MDIAGLVLSIIALIISSIVAFIQWKNRDDSRRSRDFNTISQILNLLSNDKAREEREFIYVLRRDESKDFSDISKVIQEIGQGRVDQIERTINRMDQTAFFLEKGYTKNQEVPSTITETVSEMWQRLEPFVKHFRTQPGRKKGYAIYFERFAKSIKIPPAE